MNLAEIKDSFAGDEFSLNWFDIETCNWSEESTCPGHQDKIHLSPPAEGQWVVIVK